MLTRKHVRAVGFDLDGTLIDTAGDLAHAANLMLADLQRQAVAPAVIQSFIGKGIANLVRRALTVGGQPQPSEAELDHALLRYEHHYWNNLTHSSRVYDGVVTGLRIMREAGFPLACITNKSSRFTLALLERLGLAESFQIIVSGDSLARKKPDPLPFLHVCGKFNIAPSEFLYIGDSANDTEAARAAGSPVFVVAYGYHQRNDPAELGADAVVAGLVEAADLIENTAL